MIRGGTNRSNHFDRSTEYLWFGILRQLGCHAPTLSEGWDDSTNATDIVTANGKRFGVRTRNTDYPPAQLEQFMKEFTIRYSLTSGQPTEYHKLFLTQDIIKPDYLGYGWTDDGERIHTWMFINVAMLISIEKQGYLEPFKSNIRRNIDERPSQLLPIQIEPLLHVLDKNTFNKLFPRYSQDHPVFKQLTRSFKFMEPDVTRPNDIDNQGIEQLKLIQ